jgi:hypothetical protein
MKEETTNNVNVYDIGNPYTVKCKNGHTHVFNYPNVSQLEIFERLRSGQMSYKADGEIETEGNAYMASFKLWQMTCKEVQGVENWQAPNAVKALEKKHTVELMWDNCILDDDEVKRLVENPVDAVSSEIVLYMQTVYQNKRIRTVHVMREPGEEEIGEYQEAVARSKTKKRKNKIIAIPAATILTKVNFYDKLFINAQGYRDADPASIPIPHKLEVVEHLVALVKEDTFETEGN